MKTLRVRFAIACLLSVAVPVGAVAENADSRTASIALLLDNFHQAASDADADLYFNLFTDDAVFLGTDATERWPIEDFKAFAAPRFAAGQGWTYRTTERHIKIAPDGSTAGFDELLAHDRLGQCRSSGAVVKTSNGWKVAQYNLSIPIPNALADEFVVRIKKHADAK